MNKNNIEHNDDIASKKIGLLFVAVLIMCLLISIKANAVVIVDTSNPNQWGGEYFGHYGGALDGTISADTSYSGGQDSDRYIDIGRNIYFDSNYTITLTGSTQSKHRIKWSASLDNKNWVDLSNWVSGGGTFVTTGRYLNQTFRYFRSSSNTSNAGVGTFKLKIEVNDQTAPTLSLGINPTSFTNGSVTINAIGSDNVEVSKIQTPDGNWIDGSNVTYTVSSNGTYNFAIQDTSGNIGYQSIIISNIETSPPTATSVSIQNQDENGYDVYVYGVSDSQSGINRVQFPTWTDYNGQDDIQTNWWDNSSATGTNLGGGTWKYHVNKSDHNNELGIYHSHIYIYDNAGNYNCLTSATTLKWNDDASIISNDIPTSMEAGKAYTVHVTVMNIGNKTWDVFYKLGAVGDNDNFASTRQYLPSGTTIAPGSSYTFVYTMTAPTTPGTYTTDWRMVHEGVNWFGNTISKNIVVTDTTAPTFSVTPNNFDPSSVGWTNKTQTIVVNASDSGSGVKNIKLPDGNYVSGSTANYIVSSNGTYTFSVTDNSNNIVSKTIVVSNIDTTLPTITITESTEQVTNQNITLNVSASDKGSGVKRITLPDGTIVNGSNGTFNVISNGSYIFTVEDNAGNKVTSSFNVNNIVVINNVSNVDHIEYKLDGATVQDWTIYHGSLTITNEGITTISARAVDKAGNYSNIATSPVKLDRSKPINGNIQVVIK